MSRDPYVEHPTLKGELIILIITGFFLVATVDMSGGGHWFSFHPECGHCWLDLAWIVWALWWFWRKFGFGGGSADAEPEEQRPAPQQRALPYSQPPQERYVFWATNDPDARAPDSRRDRG